jgi:hypothetical protein
MEGGLTMVEYVAFFKDEEGKPIHSFSISQSELTNLVAYVPEIALCLPPDVELPKTKRMKYQPSSVLQRGTRSVETMKYILDKGCPPGANWSIRTGYLVKRGLVVKDGAVYKVTPKGMQYIDVYENYNGSFPYKLVFEFVRDNPTWLANKTIMNGTGLNKDSVRIALCQMMWGGFVDVTESPEVRCGPIAKLYRWIGGANYNSSMSHNSNYATEEGATP